MNVGRPYIFCHMMTSLDGKIMGKYMDAPESGAASNAFYQIAFGKQPKYHHQGWLSGRVTTDDNFTLYRKPALEENAAPVPEGDFVARNAAMYYVSIDPSGRLGWEDSTLTYGRFQRPLCPAGGNTAPASHEPCFCRQRSAAETARSANRPQAPPQAS